MYFINPPSAYLSFYPPIYLFINVAGGISIYWPGGGAVQDYTPPPHVAGGNNNRHTVTHTVRHTPTHTVTHTDVKHMYVNHYTKTTKYLSHTNTVRFIKPYRNPVYK